MSSPEKSLFYWRQHPQFIGDESKLSHAPSRSFVNRTRSDKQNGELDGAIALSLASRAPSRSLVNRTRSDTHTEELNGAIALSLASRAPSRCLDNRARSDKHNIQLDGAIALSLVSHAPSRSFDNRTRSNKQYEKLDGVIALSSVSRAPSRSSITRTRSDKQKEELDRAIALSLAETLKKPNAYKWQSGDDNDLTKSHKDDFHPSPIPYVPMGYRVCSACGNPITGHEFSLSGKDAYHKLCFKESTNLKCEVCFQFIPTNRAGINEYRCHPFWSQKYCPAHDYDNTARCCSCERLESVNVRYTSLGDGRSLCSECMESAIMDTGDCQPLYHSIRDYYEGMNMRLDQQIPMFLVERQALQDATLEEKNGLHYLPDARGICLSEEQTVASILKRPKIGGQRLVGMRTQPQKLTRRCEVTAILVLYGLPRLLTGAILAHQLMHAWLRLKGYRNLDPEVEEGICQVLSYMWLESEIMPGLKNMPSSSSSTSSSSSSSSSKKGGKSRNENKLGEFFMHQIANDPSPTYGGGFRAANAAVNTYGLRRTLDHIRLTGSFPL